MTATAHALVGGVIAATTKDPLLGATLSLMSHPLLDMVPHWDFAWGWRDKSRVLLFCEATGDLLGGLLLAYLFFGANISFWYLSLCVFLALSFDFIEVPYWFFGWRFFPFSVLHSFQSKIQGKAKLPWGVINQIIVVSLIIFVFTHSNF